jgi:D-alanine-D-alanine ligase
VRTAVVYDHAAERGGSPDTAGVLDAVDAVVESLGRIGHAAFPVAAAPPLDRLLSRLAGVDLVFNLAEGLGGRAEEEPRLAALLELSGRPVTGAPGEVLALCRRKDRVNALLSALAVPVPAWTVAGPGERPEWRVFPAIVKPAGEDGSVGIDERSVVEDGLELAAALDRAAGESVVQAFVPGRELNVGLVGDAVLPVSEIAFAGRHRLVTYAAKWSPGSEADRATRPVCPARISATLHGAAVDLARRAWAAVGGRGYGRVDLRTDADGRLHVLEVNPNPDLAPSAGLARMAWVRGWAYDELVGHIVAEALR